MTELMKEIRLDITELQNLLAQAERKVVRDELQLAIRRAETRYTHENEKNQVTEGKTRPEVMAGAGGDSVAVSKTRYVKDIQTYAWDQSDKFMKIYVTLPSVQDIDSDNITCEFEKRSLKFLVIDLDGKDHSLNVVNLHSDIIPGDSYYKVKKDSVLIMMKKSSKGATWSHMKKQQDKKEPKAPAANNDDPSSGIMDMLKNIYDTGDDNMKRTINKAWSQSRDKNGALPEMP